MVIVVGDLLANSLAGKFACLLQTLLHIAINQQQTHLNCSVGINHGQFLAVTLDLHLYLFEGATFLKKLFFSVDLIISPLSSTL